MSEDRKKKARAKLKAAAVAVSVAFSGFIGNQTADVPSAEEAARNLASERSAFESTVASKSSELRDIVDEARGITVRQDTARFGDVIYRKPGTNHYAIVTVAYPDKNYTVEQIDKWLERYEILRKLVLSLRSARVEYEATE